MTAGRTPGEDDDERKEHEAGQEPDDGEREERARSDQLHHRACHHALLLNTLTVPGSSGARRPLRAQRSSGATHRVGQPPSATSDDAHGTGGCFCRCSCNRLDDCPKVRTHGPGHTDANYAKNTAPTVIPSPEPRCNVPTPGGTRQS